MGEKPIILEQYIDYLRNIKNLLPSTIYLYTKSLLSFFEYIKFCFKLDIEVIDFNSFILSLVEEKHIYMYLTFLNEERNNSPATRNRKLTIIKSFYKWLYNLNNPNFKNNTNPVENIKQASVCKRIPKNLDLEQAKKLQTVFNKSNCKNYKRNNTIIILFLHTGIRLSSLENLNINDIDFNKSEAKIIVKGNKEQMIYIDKFTMNILQEYLETRNDDNIALFTTSKGNRLKKRSIEHICQKAFKLINLGDRGYSTHTLRHTAATIMYKNTKDILLVKEFLGHKSINTTMIYSKVDNEILRQAVESHPLNNYIL